MSAAAVGTRVICDAAARVVACRTLCREHVGIELSLPLFPDSTAGQFLQLLCRDDREQPPRAVAWEPGRLPELVGVDWEGRRAYLRRPFSIADRWRGADGSARLLVISRAVGVGTSWLERLREGDSLSVTGPLGRGFDVAGRMGTAVLVGGGVGIPPLIYLARQLHERGQRDVLAIFGATSGDLLPIERSSEPERAGDPRACLRVPGSPRLAAIVTTDDGSLGLKGRVTDGLRGWLARRARTAPCESPMVLACGPEPMLSAVSALTREFGVGCQLCIERTMGCGLGTCLSCVVRVRDAGRDAGWRWALTCVEGPVFDRDELFDVDGAPAQSTSPPAAG